MLTTTPVTELITSQRQFFATGKTKDVNFRIAQLKKLKQAIKEHQNDVLSALKADLNKPEFESFFELVVTQDIDHALKQIKSWVKPKKAKVNLNLLPGSAQVIPEPLGTVLIIGPWNYPFSLMISPLIGAIAAGNCAILKPSEVAPQTSQVVAKLIQENFDPSYITVVEGAVETAQQLLAENFDHIFFTGGTKVGKIIMEAAAKNLTPVTLELGGKSPCVVDTEIDLKETAKRITWGKFLNAGQTCIAPDYLLVNKGIKANLVTEIKQCIENFYGTNPAESPDFARIISDRQFNRLQSLLQDGDIITGGETNPQEHYIAPTLMENVSLEAPLMEEEIFGPILPILEYNDLTEAINFINQRPKPLALYLFSKNKQKQTQILEKTSSGGVCLNDTIMHVGVTDLPFGGVGNSGIGSYHGKHSFDTFSHFKSVLKKPFLFDLNWRYAPYEKKLAQMRKLLGI